MSLHERKNRLYQERQKRHAAEIDAVWIDESHQIPEPKESEGFKISLQIEDSENSDAWYRRSLGSAK